MVSTMLRRKRTFLTLAALATAVTLGLVVPLAVGSPSGSGADELPPEKQQAIDREEELAERGRQNPARVPPNPEQAGPEVRPGPWPAGIFGKEEADFPTGSGYEFENLWRKVIHGQFVAVYAGGRSDQPTEGVVLVMTIEPGTWGHRFDAYVTPIAGHVVIVSADGLRLTLRSKSDGSEVVFDVESRAFSP